MKRKIIILYLSLVMIATAFGVIEPASKNGAISQIIDPTWERTRNYILGDRGLRDYYDADPPGTWNWTSSTWIGDKSDLLYYDKVGPDLPPGYVFHYDQWFYTADYSQSPDNLSTIYWFRTNLYIDSIDAPNNIKMLDKYSPNQPHIAVNDNIWVFVNGVYTGEARGKYQGSSPHKDWNLAPTTGWIDDVVDIPLTFFNQGDNEVSILYMEMCEDGGLGHLVFNMIWSPIANAGHDQIVFVGDTVFFDGTGSYDPDGTIVSYEWDFDESDGLWWETGAPPDAVGPLPTHIYTDFGIYTATLNVTDNDGSSDTDTCEITVLGLLPPTLNINVSQDGRDVQLYWDPPPNLGLDYYLIYRSTSQTNFDFTTIWKNTSIDLEPGESSPIPLRTMWNDTNAAFPANSTNYEEQYYYTIRAVNILGKISGTSRTMGKWTKMFPQGISTFSLPLEPLEPLYTDYCTSSMKADYIKYMNVTTCKWIKHNFGDGNKNNTQMKLGEGYEVKFASQTNYTFTGMPGAMIRYKTCSFVGFDYNADAKTLSAKVDPMTGDVTLTWNPPFSMDGDDQYNVYYSPSRDGFHGIEGSDFFILATVPFDIPMMIHPGAALPGSQYYYMIIPVNEKGVEGASTYSIGVWTEEYLSEYDTLGIPLKQSFIETADWFCDNIPNSVGINYYIHKEQRWGWHSTRMAVGVYDPILEMTEGYQISTSNVTKYIFIGI